MSSPSDADYAQLLAAVERAHEMIRTLEAEPPSAKRDAALELLRTRHGHALARLRDIKSDSHRN